MKDILVVLKQVWWVAPLGVSVLRSGLKQVDISYITTRILVMSFPHEDGSRGNSLDEVRISHSDRHGPR